MPSPVAAPVARHWRPLSGHNAGTGNQGKLMQRTLIVIGLVIAAIGLAWPWLRRLPFGRLPGDIHVVREGFSFHFPIVTCIVISIVVSVILWLFRR